ncbi:MAG: Holliday junction branch migration protein RuvA [Lachnospiraceae bacterium]|nr:Holliday junction branch migration protein RuvA [Lachnospiraceae bacterium]
MIGFVKGKIDSIEEDRVIIDCNGIGYNIFIPGSVAGALINKEEAKLYTYLAVREDAMNLFGFLSKQDLDIFKKLITVSGIGPKGGLSIMSVMTTDDLRLAILSGDDKAISKAPGIGSKTAQKVIVELKDKVKFEDTLFNDTLAANMASPDNDVSKEAVMALVALGYSQQESARAVKSVEGEKLDVEAIIKEALRKMI